MAECCSRWGPSGRLQGSPAGPLAASANRQSSEWHAAPQSPGSVTFLSSSSRLVSSQHLCILPQRLGADPLPVTMLVQPLFHDATAATTCKALQPSPVSLVNIAHCLLNHERILPRRLRKHPHPTERLPHLRIRTHQ